MDASLDAKPSRAEPPSRSSLWTAFPIVQKRSHGASHDGGPSRELAPERAMMWFLLAAIALAFVLRLARRRHLFAVLPSDSISTIHVAMTRKHTARTKAALDAATEALR